MGSHEHTLQPSSFTSELSTVQTVLYIKMYMLHALLYMHVGLCIKSWAWSIVTGGRVQWSLVVSASGSCWLGCAGRCQRRKAASGTAHRLPGQESSYWSRAEPADTASTEYLRERLSEARPNKPHAHCMALGPNYATSTCCGGFAEQQVVQQGKIR